MNISTIPLVTIDDTTTRTDGIFALDSAVSPNSKVDGAAVGSSLTS